MNEKRVPAGEFARNFDRYRQEAASGEIVTVTEDGSPVGAFLGPQELERYKALCRRQREAYRIENLPDELADELEQGLQSVAYGT